jgi:hypothetical protein
MKRAAGVVLCVAAFWIPGGATAQSSADWQFGATLYGWLPSVKGATTFPQPPGGGSDISIDAADVLESLNFVAMGSFEARKGRWGGFTDLIYLDLGNQKSRTRNFQIGGMQVPADVTGDLTFDLKSTVWMLAGEYRTLTDAGLQLDAFLGGRMADVDQTLTYALSGNVGPVAGPDRAGRRKVSLNNWDVIVGFKGRFLLGDERRWFVPFYADIGTGESDSTYQLMSGVGYAFKWGEVVGQWRHLDYRFSGPIEKLSFSGPAVAFNFRW